MATSIVTPELVLVTALGKLHPDYTICLERPVNEVYPYLRVTNGRREVLIQIRLAENHWSVNVINRLVEKAIKQIERP